jgi:hypothetical protein
LRLGAAGAGLDIDEAVVGIHRIVEHAAELHAFDQLAQAFGIGFDRLYGFFVLLFAGHLEQVAGVAQIGFDLGQRQDDGFQGFLFLAQVLGAFLVVPDFRIFQFAIDLVEFL